MATTQADFYRKFLDNRDNFEPAQFDVHIERGDFIRLVNSRFMKQFQNWTPDELLLHPRDAERFCQDFRYEHGWFDLPDDIILRSLRLWSESFR